MIDDLCVQEALRLRYSFPRVQWLVGAMSLVSLLYLSSEEIWKIGDTEPFPEVAFQGLICYLTFFLATLISAHYIDTKRIVKKTRIKLRFVSPHRRQVKLKAPVNPRRTARPPISGQTDFAGL